MRNSLARLGAFACGVALLLSSALHAATPTGKAAGHFGAMCGGDGAKDTQVRLLTDNPDSWYARWNILWNAKKSIDVTYFIIEDDIFGRSFLGLLLKKAQEGVAVRLLIDARGSSVLSRRWFSQGYLQELAELPNVKIRVFNPWHKALLELPRDVRSLIASNHDKIVLVDEEWAITGGRNISANYFADPADMPKAYRDTDVLLKGKEMAKFMKLAFEEEFARLKNYEIGQPWLGNWENEAFELELCRRAMNRWLMGEGTHDPEAIGKEKLLRKINEELSKFPRLNGYVHFQQDVWQGRRAMPVKVLDKHSIHAERNDITPNMIELFDKAEDYILIQNPYVIITKDVFDSLKRASDRGVRIILHTNSPASTDSLITQAFFLRDWKKLLRDLPALRIYAFHGDRKLHAKTFVIDDEIAAIGTYNMDPMSEGINSEVVAVVANQPFARQSRLRIEEDIKDCVEFQIKVNENGIMETVKGPEEYLEGFSGKIIKILSKCWFLRPLV